MLKQQLEAVGNLKERRFQLGERKVRYRVVQIKKSPTASPARRPERAMKVSAPLHSIADMISYRHEVFVLGHFRHLVNDSALLRRYREQPLP